MAAQTQNIKNGGDAELATVTITTGTITTLTATLTGDVTGDLTGDVTGAVTGNVTGDVTGDVTGNVTGNVTGDVTGDVTGNVTGGVQHPVVALAASGAIAVPAVSTSYFLTKAGVAAMTLVDPTATTHDGIRLTIMSTTAQAHTLDNSAGSGFNNVGAGGDIGTFAAAVGNSVVIEAYQGVWYILNNIGVTMA